MKLLEGGGRAKFSKNLVRIWLTDQCVASDASRNPQDNPKLRSGGIGREPGECAEQ